MRLKLIILKFRFLKFLGRFIPYFKKMRISKEKLSEIVISTMESYASNNENPTKFKYTSTLNSTNVDSESTSSFSICYSHGNIIFFLVLEFVSEDIKTRFKFSDKPYDDLNISDISEIIDFYNYFKNKSLENKDDLLKVFKNVDWKS